MMRKLLKTILRTACCVCLTTAYAEPSLERGRQHFQTCIACHGQSGEGNQQFNAPVSAGQGAWYVSRQLINFREGIRGTHTDDTYGAQMRPAALALEDDQAIEDIAAYIETLPTPNPPRTVDGNVEAGRNAYVLCVACHGASAEGNKLLNAPRLSKQHDWYFVRQMKNFQAGTRGAHAQDIYGAQMRGMAQMLATDEQINDVAAYLATLD